ncbi:hypothetical protein F504_1118 [Ralstonia pseudosolanacearum FQY_4]|nr:hypothetical protein F504_1118 [Ralstonia pseudosolanacearum FQY_4]
MYNEVTSGGFRALDRDSKARHKRPHSLPWQSGLAHSVIS